MSRQRYEEYKESGVQWLGELPSHWEVKRLKYSTVSCQNGVWGEEPEGDENDIICIRVADFDREKIRVNLKNPTIRNIAATHRVSRAVQKGDLLLEKSGGGEKQPVGFVALYDEDQPAVCSNFVACMKLMPGMVPSFWRYVHAAGYSVGLNVRSIKQTSGIQNIDQASYLDERAPYPPPEEQQKIAAFLDRKTAEIDTLIAKKRRLLDRLAEKRTALITRAVTKGLNPDAPMKDSGIEWLGEVPAHWDVARLKNITQLESGHTPSKSKPEFWVDCDIPWVSLRDTKVLADNDYISQTHTYINKAGLAGSSARLLPAGTVIFTRDATVGLVAITEVEMAVSQHLIAWIPSEKIDKDYLLFVFEAMRDYLHSLEFGSTVRTIGMDDIRRLVGPVPPVSEQLEIVCFVLAERGRLQDLEARVSEAIEKLKEYRSALITNAVTGQIKVA